MAQSTGTAMDTDSCGEIGAQKKPKIAPSMSRTDEKNGNRAVAAKLEKTVKKGGEGRSSSSPPKIARLVFFFVVFFSTVPSPKRSLLFSKLCPRISTDGFTRKVFRVLRIMPFLWGLLVTLENFQGAPLQSRQKLGQH